MTVTAPKLNFYNWLIFEGLTGSIVHAQQAHDAEVKTVVEAVLLEGWIESEAILNTVSRLMKRAFASELKGADDAYARLLSTAVSGYRGVHFDEEDDEEGLASIWCGHWMTDLCEAAHRDPATLFQERYQVVTEFAEAFESVDLLPYLAQRSIQARLITLLNP